MHGFQALSLLKQVFIYLFEKQRVKQRDHSLLIHSPKPTTNKVDRQSRKPRTVCCTPPGWRGGVGPGTSAIMLPPGVCAVIEAGLEAESELSPGVSNARSSIPRSLAAAVPHGRPNLHKLNIQWMSFVFFNCHVREKKKPYKNIVIFFLQSIFN